LPDDKPPLIWHSNSPFAGTGYGQQTALFAKRLAEHYKLVISTYYGLEGSPIPWNGIPLLPAINGDFGDVTVPEHVKMLWGSDARKGLTVTLMDVWPLEPSIWRRFNVLSWCPVDHDPCPDPVLEFFHRSGAIPMAMSRFGEKQLANANLDPLYCPHAVDTDALKPLPQAEAREATGMPEDRFIVGMVAANKGNPSRKCFVEAFRAFKELLRIDSDAMLYLHTDLLGRFDGVGLVPLLRSLDVPEGSVIACDQYKATHMPFNLSTMAEIYSSLDVLLSASAGEGFGVPVVEAQACGVPVIVSDFTAQPELCGAGWLVEGTPTYTKIGSWQQTPDVDDIVDALRQCHSRTKAEVEQTSAKAREFALQYDADHVLTEYMLPALRAAAKRYEDRAPVELAA
jgi:glycosyltransferase involved in cell wall biosynthesis